MGYTFFEPSFWAMQLEALVDLLKESFAIPACSLWRKIRESLGAANLYLLYFKFYTDRYSI
jgi:hypothetical protein